jgi:hypothetical protein
VFNTSMKNGGKGKPVPIPNDVASQPEVQQSGGSSGYGSSNSW